jgi:hypothetical protein
MKPSNLTRSLLSAEIKRHVVEQFVDILGEKCLLLQGIKATKLVFNSILYYLCAESTATRPITDTAQYRYT